MTNNDNTNQLMADDIRTLSNENLLKKYPHDSVIFNAIATKQAAISFAEQRLKSDSARKRFVIAAVNKYAEKVEKGIFVAIRLNDSPRIPPARRGAPRGG